MILPNELEVGKTGIGKRNIYNSPLITTHGIRRRRNSFFHYLFPRFLFPISRVQLRVCKDMISLASSEMWNCFAKEQCDPAKSSEIAAEKGLPKWIRFATLALYKGGALRSLASYYS